MKKIITLLFAAVFTAKGIYAQTNTFPGPSAGRARICTLISTASALLEINSTTKGFLPPRMTMAQSNVIAFPAIGFIIYQTTSAKGFYYYTSTRGWAEIGGNTKLSNLTSPVAVNLALLPNTTGAFDLGSSTLNWPDIYVIYNYPAACIRAVQVFYSDGNVTMGDNGLLNNTTGFGIQKKSIFNQACLI